MKSPRIGARVEALPKWVKVVFFVLVALFCYALPLLELPIITTPDVDFGGVLFTVALYVLIALGLNIVVGYAGLLDLGYVGFYAIGAYTTAVLAKEHGHVPYLWTIPIAVVAAMLSGVILGAPTLRVRGDYLAIVTLGFGEIIRLTAVNADWLGGARGTGSPSSVRSATPRRSSTSAARSSRSSSPSGSTMCLRIST